MKNLLKSSWATATSFLSKKALVSLILLGVLLGGSVLAESALGLSYPSNKPDIKPPNAPKAYANSKNYTLSTVVSILGEIRDFILIVGIIFIVIMIVWAGIQYTTAGGDEEQQADAKQKVVGALIGAAIILAAFALIATIRNLISEQSLT